MISFYWKKYTCDDIEKEVACHGMLSEKICELIKNEICRPVQPIRCSYMRRIPTVLVHDGAQEEAQDQFYQPKIQQHQEDPQKQ